MVTSLANAFACRTIHKRSPFSQTMAKIHDFTEKALLYKKSMLNNERQTYALENHMVYDERHKN